ncbi:MAG: ROK family protein [Clostridia bacterium]|nr:ROK family protein [Clostridia bacterium]
MNIKLLVLDIDDTLVFKAGPVSDENLAAITAARKAGVYVTLATGRGYYGSSRVVKQLGLDTYVINYGGAMITDSRTGKPIFTTELDNTYVQEIMALAGDMGLHVHLYQGDCIIYERPHEYADLYCAALNLPHRLDPDLRSKTWKNVPKVLIITEPERVPELLPFFKNHFEGRVAVSGSSPGFIEFNRIGANKGTAVEHLAGLLGIDREEVCAAGDNTLDYEMIEYAGLGVVVENGNEQLKKIANLIVPSCTENGVAYLINNYILGSAPLSGSAEKAIENGKRKKRMYRIGFDIGGTSIVAGLLDEEYRIIRKLSRPFRRNATGEEAGNARFIAEDLYNLAKDVCEAEGVPFDSVPNIGICIPGSVDTAKGIVIDAHNLGLHDSPFRSVSEEVFGKPCALLNDADAAALAEFRLGALREHPNSMLVTIGTGIGVGIIIGGKLFHGGRGYGVEAGHAQMDLRGSYCTCGRRGCIETLCAATWLNHRAAELYEAAEGPIKALYETYSSHGKFDARGLIECSKTGEKNCVAVWNEYLESLSNALASYVNILDPQLIAIGGGVSGAGDYLIKPLIELTAKQSFFREPTPIIRAALGNDAGLVGAAMYTDQ